MLTNSSNQPPHCHTNRVSNHFTGVINSSLWCRTCHTNNTTNRVLYPPPFTGTFADLSGGCYFVSIILVLQPTVTHKYITCITSRHDYQLLMKRFSQTKREGIRSRLQWLVPIWTQLVQMSLSFSQLIPPWCTSHSIFIPLFMALQMYPTSIFVQRFSNGCI